MSADDLIEDIAEYSDLELEYKVIHYICFIDFSICLYVDYEVFFGESSRIIIKIIKDLGATFTKGTIKGVVLKRVSDDDYDTVDAALDDVISVKTVKSFKACEVLLKSLQDLYLQRNIIENSELAINYAKQDNIIAATTTLKQVLFAENKQLIDSGDYLEDYDDRVKIIERQKKEQDSGVHTLIPTGIPDFDKATGGIKKGEVGVLLGVTGGGKSLGKLNFAVVAWLLGFNVIHLGLEMTKAENQFRMDSLITQLSGSLFRLASLSKRHLKEWKSKISQLKKQFTGNYIEFTAGEGQKMVIDEILALVEGIEQRRGSVDLFILDHIILVKGNPKIRDNHLQHWETMQKLCNWAKQRNKAVWTSSQVTDAGMERKSGFRTNDVKYARAISELAQIILALFPKDDKFLIQTIKGRSIKKGTEYAIRPDFDKMCLDERAFNDLLLNIFKV